MRRKGCTVKMTTTPLTRCQSPPRFSQNGAVMNTIPTHLRGPWQDIQTARSLLLRRQPDEALKVLDRAQRSLGSLRTPGTPPALPPSEGEVTDERLSARERQVLTHLCRGLSNKHIALSLAIAPETVKAHIKRIFVKLEVCSRAQ